MAVIGAPITELDTAAIAETASTDINSGLFDVIGNWNTIAPSTPPKKSAGENVPPKNPNPIQIEVSINFPNKRVTRQLRICCVVITDIKISVPNPKTSLNIIPHKPQANPAMTGACQVSIFIFDGMEPKNSINFIKIIATTAAKGPISARLTKISLISNGTADNRRGGLTIPISVAEKLAAIEEIASAATAFIEKCRNTVS